MTRIIWVLLIMVACGGSAQARARGLDLVNHSHVTVESFFASRAGNDRWNEDLLARRGLRPHHFVQLDLDEPTGACRFDLKIVFSDGTSVIRRNVDVCRLGTYTLTDPYTLTD